MKKTIRYAEPAGYFPKGIRKAAKLGEYAENAPKAEPNAKKRKPKAAPQQNGK